MFKKDIEQWSKLLMFGSAQCSISSGDRTMTKFEIADTEQVDPMQAAIANPEAAQAVTLFNILKGAARTGFGVKHNFKRITSVSDFLARVPVGGLHTHRSMIELQKATGAEMLTMDEVIAYVPAFSGGLRHQSCPVTARDMINRQQMMAGSLAQFAEYGCRKVFDLSVLNSSSYGVAAGGSSSGITGFQWLSAVEDTETRAYLLCLIAASQVNVDGLVAADLAALQRMADVLARHGKHIVSDLEARTVRVHDRLESRISRRVRKLLDPASETAGRLARRVQSGQPIRLMDIFPALQVVGIDGSTGDRQWLSAELKDTTGIIDIGCSLPEGLMSFAHAEGAGTVPALLDVFFEFSEPESGQLLGLHQISEGVDYVVHVTTRSGLYRCKLNLAARVVGREGACPRLSFARLFSGMSGARKPSVIAAGAALSVIQATLANIGAPRPFVRVAGRADGGFRVTLSRCSLEALAPEEVSAAIEASLCRFSLHYDRLRELGQIAAVDVVASRATRPQVVLATAETGCSAA
jgi:hypothetical protein